MFFRPHPSPSDCRVRCLPVRRSLSGSEGGSFGYRAVSLIESLPCGISPFLFLSKTTYQISYHYRNSMSRGKRLVIGIVRHADRHNDYVPTATAENAQSVIPRLPRKPSGLVEAS